MSDIFYLFIFNQLLPIRVDDKVTLTGLKILKMTFCPIP